MTEHVRVDESDPIHSLLEFATNGGYHIATRVPDRVSLSPHPEPGIAATTGGPEVPENVYTGPCLMSPVDSTALKLGYDPVTFDPITETGEELASYEEFADSFLLGGGVPKLSQIIDHWGIQGMDGGSVVLMLEDEEWTDKVEGFLEEAGISYDHEQVFEDVRTAYGTHLRSVFENYVVDVLDNDVEIVPVFTSDYTDDIDRVLEDATRRPHVASEYAADDYYFQRIAMYTTPLWLDYLETELGLADGSLDITDPIRFYDEFYNYEGSQKNIFRDYQIEYFAQDADDRSHELLFVPPVLAPFDEGYSLESHAPHADSITPLRLDDVASRLDASADESVPNLLESPLVRLLTGFPNRAGLAVRIIQTRQTESSHRPEWKSSAVESVFGESTVEEEIQREPGVEIRSLVQRRREDVRRADPESSERDVVDLLYDALTDDLQTVFGSPRSNDV